MAIRLQRFSGAALWLSLLAAAPSAWAISDAAVGASEGAASAPPAVSVTVVGDVAAARTLHDRVLSWFPADTARERASQSNLDPEAVFATEQKDGVWVWIWLRTPSSTRLFFRVEQSGEAPRYLVTDLERELDEVGMEELGQVVYSSASALWAGTLRSTTEEVRAGLAEGAPPPPPRAVVAALPPKRAPAEGYSWKALVGAEYGLTAGVESPMQVNLGVGLRAASSSYALGGSLYAGVLMPWDQSADGMQIDTRGASFSLRAQPAMLVTQGWWFTGELGPMLDVVVFEPRSFDPALRAEPAGVDFRPGALASVGFRKKLGPVELGGGTYLVVPFVRSHFDVTREAVRREVMAPWRVQPGFRLGAIW